MVPAFEPSGQRSEMCSGANVVGIGLRGEYFEREDLQGPILLTRVDASIDFVESLDWPETLKSQPPGSVRWTGWIKAPTNGSHHFHVTPPSAQVRISRVDVRAGAMPKGDPVDMVAGRFYPITVEVKRLSPGGVPLRLEWTAPHGARYVIPKAVLNLPTDTVAPLPAGAASRN